MRGIINRLADSRDANGTLLLALGMPMLVGGAGLGVDTAQWYLWKRELQFAVDQAAIAGAWAKAADETGTTYIARARQQYDANISLVDDFDTTPDVALADYEGGTANSIMVTGSVTRSLPFSTLLTGTQMTIAARAQAIYEPGATYRPCILALDPSAPRSVLFNGTVTVLATCGVGALSDDVESVAKIGGSGSIDVGFVVTAGNILDDHGHFQEETKVVNSSAMLDPYLNLTPPGNATSRTLSCPASNNKYTADESVQFRYEYAYFKGKTKNSLTPYAYPTPKGTTTSSAATVYGKTFNNAPVNSQTVGNPSYTQVSGGGNDTIWEEETRTVIQTYTNIVAPSSGPATAQPGTYSDFTINCDTILSPGVYVLDATVLQMTGQYEISGTGVMLVLKNGASMKIAGGATMDLTAMSPSQMQAAGVASADLARMEGMLVIEDPSSTSMASNEFTGTSTQIFNGVFYAPNSALKVAGTPQGTSRCMVLASRTIEFSGTVDISTLCPSGNTPTAAAADIRNVVRLVG